MLHDLFAEHRVRLECDVPAFTVLADADKLLQVLINLLENAAVHGPDEHTVFLKAELQGAWVRVSVQDEGEPLPEGAIDRLFEPHSRGRGVKANGGVRRPIGLGPPPTMDRLRKPFKPLTINRPQRQG